MRPSILAVLPVAALLLSGCPTRDQSLARDAGDGGTSDGAGHDGADAPAPNVVTITSPTAAITYTNGSITIVVATQRPTTDSITITATSATSMAGGTIALPQTSYTWNTTVVPEGTYSVTAQLTNGGIATISNAITVVVDRTPPTVAPNGLTPVPNAADVVLVAPISVSFSEAILPATINAAAIPIQSGATAAPTTFALSPDGTTATLTITNDTNITLPNTFTATFAATITDLAGNALTQPVLPWTWTVPAWIRLAPVGSNSPPLLAVGSDYHPVIGYSVCTAGGMGCNPTLHVAVNDGQAWNDLGVPAPGAAPTGAALIIDGRNRPVVSFPAVSGGVAQVAFATWTGAAWDTTSPPAIDVPAAQGYYVDATALALDPAGKIVCAYRPNTSSTNDVYVARFTGTTWDTTFGAVGVPATKSYGLVVNDQGNPIVSAINNTGGIDGAFIWNGTSWTLSNGAAANSAAIALDAGGSPLMLNTNWQPVHLSNGSWLSTTSAAVPVSASSRDPSLATTSDRRPVVGWYDATIVPPKLGVARWTGSAWDNRTGMAGNGTGVSDAPPGLVVDGRDDIWIAWAENLQANVWMSNY